MLGIQDAGGTREAIQQGIHQGGRAAGRGFNSRMCARRWCAPSVSGPAVRGSDGYSGITANPALGAAVDLLVQQGGTAMPPRRPEIYGAEHLLTARCQPHVAERLRERIRWWEAYTAQHGGDMNNNPHPATRPAASPPSGKVARRRCQGGQTGLMEVLAYAQQPSQHGLVFMDTPGYDPVSATARLRAAPTSSASPPAAAPPTAASPRPHSRSPPTRPSSSACRSIWTSTPGHR